MVRSLWRTLLGPSRDPKMAYISRPLPRGLPDADVLAALDRALEANPDPAYLVETLPQALQEVTGRRYDVLDRSAQDVTATHLRRSVMIRDGDVGHWSGYDAMSHSMLASPEDAAAARATLTDPPTRMPGWEPPVAPPAGEERPVAADRAGPGDGTGRLSETPPTSASGSE